MLRSVHQTRTSCVWGVLGLEMKNLGAISGVFERVSSALRLRGEAAVDPSAQALHVLMLLLLSVTAPHVTIALIHFYNKLVIVQTGFPIVFTPVITLVLLWRNAVRAARVVYLVGMWVGFTQIMLLNGGIRSVGWAVYIAMAVSAAWLFGYGAALWTAGAGTPACWSWRSSRIGAWARRACCAVLR